MRRRIFLARLLAAGATTSTLAFTARSLAASAHGGQIAIGLQLYTLKAELKGDFDGTLRAVASIGIREVELIDFPLRSRVDVARMVREAGLLAVSLHSRPGSLMKDAQAQIDAAAELGVPYLIAAVPEFRYPARREVAALTLDDWRWNGELFNRVGELARRAGVIFGYHNHQFEFRRFDGVCAYDELLACTEPSFVTMQLDVGWAEYAGVDAAEYLRRYRGRFSSLHVKDVKRRASPDAGFELPGTELGSGIVDWKRVFRAASEAGVRHAFIEQESPFERPPLEAVRRSFDWLRRHKP